MQSSHTPQMRRRRFARVASNRDTYRYEVRARGIDPGSQCNDVTNALRKQAGGRPARAYMSRGEPDRTG